MFYIPLVAVIISNVIYHNASKNVSSQVSPFLSLAVTYIVACVISFALYFLLTKDTNIWEDIKKINWASIILGIVLVGLEAGYIYMYRAGWEISKGSLVANVTVAVILIVIGILVYKEHITLKQAIGIALCIGGIVLINTK